MPPRRYSSGSSGEKLNRKEHLVHSSGTDKNFSLFCCCFLPLSGLSQLLHDRIQVFCLFFFCYFCCCFFYNSGTESSCCFNVCRRNFLRYWSDMYLLQKIEFFFSLKNNLFLFCVQEHVLKQNEN